MKLLDKYLLRQFLTAVLYCLSAFVLISLVMELFEDLGQIIAARRMPVSPLSLSTIVKYYGISILDKLEFLLPSSLLLGALYALWNLTRHNELIAMRAAGISLTRIMAPFVTIGMIFSILSLANREWFMPDNMLWARTLSGNKFTNQVGNVYFDHFYMYNARSGFREWAVGELQMSDPPVMFNVRINWERKDYSNERIFIADQAEFLDGQWWFYNMQVIRPTNGVLVTNSYPLMEIRGMRERPTDIVSYLKKSEFWTTEDFRRKLKTAMSDKTYREFTVKMHRRLATPWACLIVTFFAVPAGTRTARHSTLSGIFMALAAFVLYYMLLGIGSWLGMRGIVWPWLGAWLSNITFVVSGTIMTIRLR